MTFKQAQKKLKKLANGEYHNISYKETIIRVGKKEIECEVYVNGYRYHYSNNWSDTLLSLEKEMYPERFPIPKNQHPTINNTKEI